MTTIKNKLLSAFLVIIGVLSVMNVSLFLMHFVVVEKYKAVSDSMVAEYALINTVPELIAAYNSRFLNTNINEEIENSKILATKKTLSEKTDFLDTHISDRKSHSNYLGLKNTIADVVDEVDAGLVELEQGNITAASEHYEEANKKYLFVKENSNKLIFSELGYVESIQKNIDDIYQMSSFLSIFIFVVVGAASIVYAFRFSNKIAYPLRKLTKIAEEVSAGHVQPTIRSAFNRELLERSDEIGILARSYSAMLAKLIGNISELDASNKEFQRISQAIAVKNAELEKFNQFMVNRELKMIELKKKLKEYEEKYPA